MKFQYIKIDLESQTTATCHAAQPHKIDFAWLEKNPGDLFNHGINLEERQMMLRNERAPSCEQNCWYAEDHGQMSPRILQKGYQRTHDQVNTSPEIIDFTVGPQCNLTCSYCCKEFSSAWRKDLDDNGPYDLSLQYQNRFRLTDQDRILMNISQPSLLSSSRYTLLLDEINRMSGKVKRMDVTGGEPFLNNRLIDFLNDTDIPSDSAINIYTGLGVDNRRFDRMLKQLSSNRRVQIIVSAEGIGPYLEFNRYGITWGGFQKNLQCVIDHNIKFRFQSTITNLTAFGFVDFFKLYDDKDIKINFAYQPRMQSLHVMDDQSKQHLIKQFENLPAHFYKLLADTIQPDPTDDDRLDMKNFLQEFCRRRPSLDLAIYPRSFLSWLEI